MGTPRKDISWPKNTEGVQVFPFVCFAWLKYLFALRLSRSWSMYPSQDTAMLVHTLSMESTKLLACDIGHGCHTYQMHSRCYTWWGLVGGCMWSLLCVLFRCACVCVHAYMCVYVCVHVCMHVCTCVCVNMQGTEVSTVKNVHVLISTNSGKKMHVLPYIYIHRLKASPLTRNWVAHFCTWERGLWSWDGRGGSGGGRGGA